MGRRGKKQEKKYSAQFDRTKKNKLRNFLKHDKNMKGTRPTAKSNRKGMKEPIL